MKDFVKKITFPTDGQKKVSLPTVSEEWRRKWLVLARKSVSASRNKLLAVIFLKIGFHLISIMVFTSRKKFLKSVFIRKNKVTF